MFGIESYKNKDELLEEQYKAKYLKYKQKYLELSQTGGFLSGVGKYAILTTETKAKELIDLFKKCQQSQGSSDPFNVELGSDLLGNLNVTYNIDFNDNNKKNELDTLIENKKAEFSTLINSEKTKFNKIIDNKRNELDTLIENKKAEFSTLINSEKTKFNKIIDNKRNEYTKLFKDFYIQCINPSEDLIKSTLHDNAYIIKQGPKQQEAHLIISNTKIDLLKKGVSKAISQQQTPHTFENTQKVTATQNKVPFTDIAAIPAIKNSINNANANRAKKTELTHYVIINMTEEGMIGRKKTIISLESTEPVSI